MTSKSARLDYILFEYMKISKKRKYQLMEFQFIKNIYKKKVTKPTLAVPTYDCPKERELLDVSMSSPHGTEGRLEHEDGCMELKINGLKRFLAP